MKEWMFFSFGMWVCVCVFVCASRRPYVTDPRQGGGWGRDSVLRGPFKVMATQRGRLRTIEGGKKTWESPFIALTFLFVSPPLNVFSSLSFFFVASLCLFVMTVPLCVAPGESALGSWCDTVMRRDMVIQQFQPKGHICSLSFGLYICLCIYLSQSLFLLSPSLSLFIYWGCTLQFLPGYQGVFTTYSALHSNQKRLFVTFDFWIWIIVKGFVDCWLLSPSCPAALHCSFNWLVLKSILIS